MTRNLIGVPVTQRIIYVPHETHRAYTKNVQTPGVDQKIKARLSNRKFSKRVWRIRKHKYIYIINCILQTFTFRASKTFRNNEGEYFFGASLDFYIGRTAYNFAFRFRTVQRVVEWEFILYWVRYNDNIKSPVFCRTKNRGIILIYK